VNTPVSAVTAPHYGESALVNQAGIPVVQGSAKLMIRES
jgi:hypothetical protein